MAAVGGAEWAHGLFGCFDNCGLCIITYFVPCLTAGQNAEAVGKNCLLWGFLATCGLIGVYTIAVVRKEVREQKGIEGTMMMDCITTWCCPLCVIIQTAQELQGGPQAQGQSMARE